jgi:hypothetical protein
MKTRKRYREMSADIRYCEYRHALNELGSIVCRFQKLCNVEISTLIPCPDERKSFGAQGRLLPFHGAPLLH